MHSPCIKSQTSRFRATSVPPRGRTSVRAMWCGRRTPVTSARSTHSLLPRTRRDISRALGDFVVVTDTKNRVLACAALSVYTPFLAEVSSVAVARSVQGKGLGTIAVRGAEAIARERGISELFAMTTAEAFFESLGYERASVEQYPEKLARYEMLRAAGVQVVERSCYRKLLIWLDRVAAPPAARPRRPRRRLEKQRAG
jgi:N-acetylglutamate synthase-like GNAT family acetyltransferase